MLGVLKGGERRTCGCRFRVGRLTEDGELGLKGSRFLGVPGFGSSSALGSIPFRFERIDGYKFRALDGMRFAISLAVEWLSDMEGGGGIGWTRVAVGFSDFLGSCERQALYRAAFRRLRGRTG